MSWRTKWTTDEIWPIPEWWPLLEEDRAGTQAQEIQEVTRLWMEATREHGQFTKCESVRSTVTPGQVRHCSFCQSHYDDPLYTWKLTRRLNGFGEEVDLNATGLAVPSR